MITSCIIFLATFGSGEMPAENQVIEQYQSCQQHVPKSMQQHASLYYEHFDEENIDIAVRIGWCESRGKSNAVRTAEGNFDTGVMQFVSWTWNWVAEEYDMPLWNEWIILRWGRPYDFNGKTYRTNMGFEQTKAQYSAYYNIKMASILAEDIYGRTQWRDWNSSKWCWGDLNKFNKLWQSEK